MLQHGACQQQNKRASDTAQWLEQSQGHFTCLFVCCEKKVRLSEVKSLNLSLVCLRVFCKLYRHRRCCTDPKRRSTRTHAASGCKPEFSQSCAEPHGRINCPADIVPSYRRRNCDCKLLQKACQKLRSIPEIPLQRITDLGNYINSVPLEVARSQRAMKSIKHRKLSC